MLSKAWGWGDQCLTGEMLISERLGKLDVRWSDVHFQIILNSVHVMVVFLEPSEVLANVSRCSAPAHDDHSQKSLPISQRSVTHEIGRAQFGIDLATAREREVRATGNFAALLLLLSKLGGRPRVVSSFAGFLHEVMCHRWAPSSASSW
jgi:hypothetical protein